MSPYVREYMSHLDDVRLTDVCASDHALTLQDRHKVVYNIDNGACVKCWLHYSGRGMYVSRFICTDKDCNFVSCYKEVE